MAIAFVHNIEYNALSYPYALHNNISFVVIKDTSLFDIYDIAHEIGHVLGAGHTPDKKGISTKNLKVKE